MDKNILNILITGAGGQGVNTISKLIRKMAATRGYSCQGATFKGGAQRMGTVYCELRLVLDPDFDDVYASEIPPHQVDVLISMELWESIRFSRRCKPSVKAVINDYEEPLYIQRYDNSELSNPIKTIQEIYNQPTIKNYQQLSKETYGNTKSVNILMLQDAITDGVLPFTLEELSKAAL